MHCSPLFVSLEYSGVGVHPAQGAAGLGPELLQGSELPPSFQEPRMWKPLLLAKAALEVLGCAVFKANVSSLPLPLSPPDIERPTEL